MYVLHQTVIVALALEVVAWRQPWRYGALVIASTAVTFAIYHAIGRPWAPLRRAFGQKR